MLTIVPPPARRSDGIVACMPRKTPTAGAVALGATAGLRQRLDAFLGR
jgi:hypothetical protein